MSNKLNDELTPDELDHELSPDDLEQVSGGCAAAAHYKTVVIEMRKAGGDQQSSGKAF